MPDAVAEMRIAPLQVSDDLLRISVQQEFVRVEAQPFGGVIWPMDAVTVDQSRPCFGKVAVPDLISLFPDINALEFTSAGGIKETKFNFLRMLREKREVHTFAVPSGSKRIGFAWPDDGLGTDYHRRSRL